MAEAYDRLPPLSLRHGPGRADLYFCQAVLHLKAQHPGVTLEAAIPLRGPGRPLAPRRPAPAAAPAEPMRPGNGGPAPLHQGLYAPPEPPHGGPLLLLIAVYDGHPPRGAR
ncbi:MAG: hypothetical protein ACLUNZ_10825 [Evtepia sp.]